jgi:anti-sigma factor (TIGR02949 family)
MNIVHFGEGACEKTRRYLDSYIDNELLVETNHEVLRHLESCASCSAEVDARTRLRSRLKTAVQSQTVPPDLQVRVRERIHAHSRRPEWIFGWSRWAAAAAMAVLVIAAGIGTWRANHLPPLPGLGDRPAQDSYISRISETISSVLSPGLKDHVHCSVFRKYPKNAPTLEQMAKSMGQSYGPLVQLVKANVPDQYRIIMAHQCGYKGRRYVHLTMSDGVHLISLVIARKQEGETLEMLQPALRPGGIPVYQAAAERFEVAGFETARYLAFVVSDMRGGQNLQIAGGLAPAVHNFLATLA